MAESRYLLDTNIISELVNNPRDPMAQAMLAEGKDDVCCTSIIVVCELRYAAAKKQSPNLTDMSNRFGRVCQFCL